MEKKQIVFTQKDTAELLIGEVPAPNEKEVVVKTYISTISCGTERANISGNPNVSYAEPGRVVFPRYAGYSSSGIVVEKGAAVTGLEIGDRVIVSWGNHQNYNVVSQDQVTKIPYDNISFEEAALFHIGTFPLAAIRKTGLEIGESMLIMGLGILGLMAVQFARAAGATPVIAADPVAERRETALKLGADYALDPTAPDFAARVKALTQGGVNTAVEVTGLGAGLDQALDCMARFGRVALLGCTRSSDFTIDYYRKVHGPGITLIGAHTNARPKFESHAGWFTQKEDLLTQLRLSNLGRLDLSKMICETYSPAQCTEVYSRLVNDRNCPPVVQFDWSRLE